MEHVQESLSQLHAAPKRKAYVWRFLDALMRKPLGVVGACLCLAFIFCGVFAPWLAPYKMNEVRLAHRMQGPSALHLLGTDHLGRDLLTRLLYGAQVSVIIGFSGAGLAIVISGSIGIMTGYFGGRIDAITQRVVDAWMCFPALIVLIVFAAVVGPGTAQIIVLLGLVYGIGGSRIVRSAVLPLREQLFVEAARSLGANAATIHGRHILPNVFPPIIVLFTTNVGAVILTESSLSFLGLGIPPPTPTWGNMLTGAGRSYMYLAPWLALGPGICLALVVYGINVFGDALRDLLDPRMRGSK
jgi:peptide/nickel transport system permease protein